MMISEVELCGLDSSSLPVLKEEEMNELLFKLQHDDYTCKEVFIKANTKLMLNVIQHFNNRGESTANLFEVACIGVMKSAYKFNLSLRVRFSTYAVPIIISEVREYLKASNPIRASSSLRNIAYSALQVRDKLKGISHREPTISQIAKALELPVEDVVFALDTLHEPKEYRLRTIN